MDSLVQLSAEIRSLPIAAVLVPAGVFLLYWVVSRLVRRRVQRAWAHTLVLLLDVVVIPAVVLALEVQLTGLDGEFAAVRNTLWALLTVSIAWLATRLLRRFLWKRYFTRRYGTEAPRLLQHLVSGVLYLAALGIVLIVIFGQSAGGFLVSTGVIVGVVGLALQQVLGDLFSGITIALEQPYGVGDWITLPNDVRGEVIDITWQATYLRSFNNGKVVVPNSYATRNVVHNLSRPTRPYATWLYVSVDRSYPLATVRRLLLESALTCRAVRDDPTPVVNVTDASGNPVRYVVYVYFRDFVSHFAGINDLYMSIHAHLSRAGISTSAGKYEVSTEPAEERTLQMPSLREELRHTEIFSVLSDEQIDVLAEHSSYHTFYPEETIVTQGSDDTSLLIVVSGVVQVMKSDDRGRQVEVARLGSGDIIGEMSLLTGERRSATVTAIVQTTLIQVTKEALEPILQAQPALSDAFAQVMLDRRLKTEQFLESMKQSDKAASDFVSDYVEAFVRRIRRFFRV